MFFDKSLKYIKIFSENKLLFSNLELLFYVFDHLQHCVCLSLRFCLLVVLENYDVLLCARIDLERCIGFVLNLHNISHSMRKSQCKYKNTRLIVTYFHRKSDENRMTNSTKIEQTAIIADVCSIELFRKFASKFCKREIKCH